MEQATGRGERVAFFGGSFDPPHEGHLAIARAAKVALDLDKVLFAPVGAQPLKPGGSTAGFEDRVAMTRLAVEGDLHFAVSLVDAPKPAGGPNYTLDTLLQLTAEMAPGGSLFCLMGSDSFFGLRRWHRAAEIPFVAPLIVASRPGQPLNDLMGALPAGLTMTPPAAESGCHAENGSRSSLDCPSLDCPGLACPGLACFVLGNASGAAAPLYLLTGLDFDVSASQVREQIHRQGLAGQAAPVQVPATVMDYIRAHELYR
jgi:nicotinate-nucleotide adenylyltransferase